MTILRRRLMHDDDSEKQHEQHQAASNEFQKRHEHGLSRCFRHHGIRLLYGCQWRNLQTNLVPIGAQFLVIFMLFLASLCMIANESQMTADPLSMRFTE